MRFSNRLTEQKLHHRFRVYDVEADEIDLIGELADLVRELYTDVEALRSAMVKAMEGLGDVADVSKLGELIDNVVDAAIPTSDENPKLPSQLELPRNELAEILAYQVGLRVHAATIPAKRVRQKEVPGQPARGIDLLAIVDQDSPQLLVTEVKASESSVSPPSVVCAGVDSLRQQTLDAINDPKRLTQELNWALKHCDPGDRVLVAKTLIRLSLEQVQLVAAPVLVRSNASYSRTDFGCFEDDPNEFSPARVDFVIVRLPAGIRDLASNTYERARASA